MKNYLLNIEKTMKKYIFILIASVMATSAMAQTITPQQEREFYQKVYALFGEYAQSASVSDEDEEYSFRKLFANGDLQICNDLMSLSHEEKLSVNDYISTLQGAKRVKVVVRNIKKDGPVEDGGDVWTLPIVFEKSLSYSKSGTLFNSFDYFDEFYRLRAIVVLNKYGGECYIGSLEADPKYKWLSFPEKFRVLERTREENNVRNYKRDSKLTVNGREIRWNLYGQMMLHDGDIVKYNNSKVELEEITTGRDGGTKLRANYNDKSWRIRANLGFSLSGFNKVVDANRAIETPKNSEMSYGLDIGYVFPSTSKFYVGLFTGVNMSSNKLTMEMAPQSNSSITDIADCTADEDGDIYTRQYTLLGKGVTQELSASNLIVPFYIDFEYQMIPMISVYADLGAKLQMTSGKWSASIDGYETSGKNWRSSNNTPTDYYGVTIGGDVNLDGFGSWTSRKEFNDIKDEEMENKMAINAMAGIGLRLNLSKLFAFDLGAQYVAGSNSWKIKGDKKHIFDYGLPDGYETMNAEQKADGDMVNLMRQTNGIKQNALRISASIIYKF